jgi:hypothetical protein
LIYHVSRKADEVVNLDMLRQIQQQAMEPGFARASRASEWLGDAVAGIQRNLNRRMILEKFLIGMIQER